MGPAGRAHVLWDSGAAGSMRRIRRWGFDLADLQSRA